VSSSQSSSPPDEPFKTRAVSRCISSGHVVRHSTRRVTRPPCGGHALPRHPHLAGRRHRPEPPHLSDEANGTGARAEALSTAREAVKIRRELAANQPSAYLPDLAASLNNLASILSEQGDASSLAEALITAREAVQIRRDLANKQPSAYLPDLAMSLNNLATFLSEQGDASSRAEALSTACEAVAVYALLYSQMPSAFERNFGVASRTLIRIANEQGLDGQAEWQRVIDGLRGAAE
jgi:hypothetical protein